MSQSVNKKKKINRAILHDILKLLKPYRMLIVASFIFAAVTVVLQLISPIMAGRAIDYIIDKNDVKFGPLIKLLVMMGIVILFAVISQWIMNLINNKVTYKVVKDLRDEAFERLEKLPLSYIDRQKAGDIVSRMIADVDQFSDGLLMGFTQLFTGVVTILGTIGFMLAVNLEISLVVLLITPLSLFVASFVAKKTYSMFTRMSEERGKLTSLVDEMIGNEKVVEAFSYEDEAAKRFDEINESLTKASLKATFFSSLTNPSTRFINNVVYACVGLIGAYACVKKSMTVGELTIFLSYATQFAKPFNEITGVMTELQNAFACAGRVIEFTKEEPEVPDDVDAVSLDQVDGKVELKDISFSYVPEKKLIEHLDVNVESGQRIAIVGPTGCGKSTLINLLMRFYDVTGGSVEVDGNDIRHVTRESLRRNYGMVLQETWLKSGTIFENIAYGRPDASLDEVIESAKLSHAHNFIKRLPDGYDTVIAEDGGNLSEGQKQLLCITRVILDLPPMLILDEATSSIDTRTELIIQDTFAKMMKGRTSFIVAHRLSTIKEADKILVMKDGTIIEQGTHQELLAQQGFYSNLYNSQFAN